MGLKRRDMADRAAVERLLRSESDRPREILGPHLTDQGLRIRVFIPTASSVSVRLLGGGEKAWPMERTDAAGIFTVLLPGRAAEEYVLEVTYDNGQVQRLFDPYAYGPRIADEDLKKFDAGVLYDAYRVLGAHPMELGGVKGTHFAVWAPCAMRVSVVGDFNLWDGRRHPMERRGGSGVFELFVPGIGAGTIYKYEVKTQEGAVMLKADPYGTYAEVRPDNASVVWDTLHYTWSDGGWMRERAAGRNTSAQRPMSIYEVHLGSWMRRPSEDGRPEGFLNYRELAVHLADYAEEMGYTHVELMPVMEHPLDASWGYQTTGYFAPTSRHGSPDDFQYFMDYMHRRNIGIILDWTPAQFPRDLVGLACFDGSCVYEHRDPRRGTHPQWGTLIYNYARPQVANFLIASALYWTEVFHADGIRVDSAAAMLYLDYGKSPGQWIPNIYGGNENLEAEEFLKRLAACFHRRDDGALLMAEESAAWPQVTGDLSDGALGFDYKWNNGWMNDFLGYMCCEPRYRHQLYGSLTFSMLYAYSEDFVLALPHQEMAHGKNSMFGKMPGDTRRQKLACLRAAYGFWATHPGKKLLFMGQDTAMDGDWSEERGLDWELDDDRRQFKTYVQALNRLYRSHPALYRLDNDPDGFEWIDCLSSRENILVYLRRTKRREETLLVICNFLPQAYEEYRVGVPFRGRYEEIFTSDDAAFGGSGARARQTVCSCPQEQDGRKESAVVRVAPMGFQVFACMPAEGDE